MTKFFIERNSLASLPFNAAGYYSVYLLMGTEPFFIDQITTALTGTVSGRGQIRFRHHHRVWERNYCRSIGKAAKRFPMIGSHQLIVVKEAQYLDRSIDQLAIIAVLPNRSLYLYFVTNTKKLDKRKKGVQGDSTKWANLEANRSMTTK